MLIVRPSKAYPFPEQSRGRPEKYPWRTMEVGASFVMQGASIERACNTYYKASRRTGRRFTARVTGPGTKYPDEPQGAMVWRVS